MPSSAFDEPIYKPHEARIHGTVFDSLSKPLLNRTNYEESRYVDTSPHRYASESRHSKHSNSSSTHITWNHFGQKHHIHLNEAELAGNQNLLELLYRKIHALVPEFRGNLAYEDAFGHEVLLNDDQQLRDLLEQRRGRIRVFTTLSNNSPPHLAASELSDGHGHDGRSHQQILFPSQSEPNLLQKACADISSKRRDKKDDDTKKRKPSPPAPQRLPFIGYGSGNVSAIPPPPPLGICGTFPSSPTQIATYWPVAFCDGHPFAPHFPLFIRGSWIGPNKFWGGGSWGGGGGLWGGIGQIPSGRFWHSAAGGRPPW